jgi:hypothetical protein
LAAVEDQQLVVIQTEVTPGLELLARVEKLFTSNRNWRCWKVSFGSHSPTLLLIIFAYSMHSGIKPYILGQKVRI